MSVSEAAEVAGTAESLVAIACSIHRKHSPEPTYAEKHHVIPQAWQFHYQPPTPWPNQGPSPDHSGKILWDARVIDICRTGHGNVHYYLVLMMHQYALTKDLKTAIKNTMVNAHASGLHLVQLDWYWAEQAISRFTAAGGSLDDLVANKLWGEI